MRPAVTPHRGSSLICALFVACSGSSQDGAGSASGWEVARPSSVGLDAASLERLTGEIGAGRWGNIHAVVVVRDGRLVHEAYFEGRDEIWLEGYRQVVHGPDVRHGLRSVSKSFAATVVGIAIDQGFIDSVDVPLSELLPEYADLLDGQKAGLTLRHVLTMSAGLPWIEGAAAVSDAGDHEVGLEEADDPIEFVLGLESEAEPGAEFHYSSGLTQVLVGVVEHATGIAFLQYADSVLFEPLGIENREWFSLGNARPAAWAGLRLTARDMAKLGQVYLSGGEWKGRSIVSPDWIEGAFAPAIETPSPRAPAHVTYSGYGFQWWHDVHEWQGRSIVFHGAIGNGGQRIIVIPEFDLVVAVFAGFYGDPTKNWVPADIVREYILPAILDGTNE